MNIIDNLHINKKIYIFLIASILCFSTFPSIAAEKKQLNALQLATDSIKKANYNDAIRFATIAINREPHDFRGYQIRGKAFALNANYINAIKDFTSSINKKANFQTYYLRADCLVAIGMYGKGITDYTTSLKMQPKDGKVLYYRARAYALSGSYEKALKDIAYGINNNLAHKEQLIRLQEIILTGKPIPAHTPASN